jgi:hypothetical protein
MKRYHIWTIGCQMNEADSGRVAAELDALGYAPTSEVKGLNNFDPSQTVQFEMKQFELEVSYSWKR